MSKKKDKKQKKFQRLKNLIGTDLCACGGGHLLKCDGICREEHRDPETGEVKCAEKYCITKKEILGDKGKQKKRQWKFGKQKDNNKDRRNS